jgi:hypothetical protein
MTVSQVFACVTCDPDAHGKDFAAHHGSDPMLASISPLIMDGLLTSATVELWKTSRGDRDGSPWISWVTFFFGIAFSLANIAATPELSFFESPSPRVHRGQPWAAAEHVDVQQRVRAEPVGAVHRHAGAFACHVQTGNKRVVVGENLTVDCGGKCRPCRSGRSVGPEPAGVRVDPQVGTGELGDVRQPGVQDFAIKVGEIQMRMVTLGTGASTLTDLGVHGAVDHVWGPPCAAPVCERVG